MVARKGGGPDDFEPTTVDPGVPDKRLLITCPELASALKAGNRENSILSQTLREAWDGKTLRTMAKNCARTATDPHLSIVGHVTRQELVKVARESDIYGGTYNRFIFLLSDRARLLPHGGNLDDLGMVPARIADVIDFARGVGRVRRSSQADRLWETVYHELTTPVGSDLMAAVLSRGEAQTLRLSLLMALAAKRTTIEIDDLTAALDLWRYSVASARVVFGQVHDPLFEKIVAAVQAAPGITRTKLYRQIGRNCGAPALMDALGRARTAGVVHCERVQTSGRPSERWFPAAIEPMAGMIKKVTNPESGSGAYCASYSPPEPAAPPPAWDPDNLSPGRYTL
jgi:hypothetical protein